MNSATFRFSKNPILFWYISLPVYFWMIIIGETRRIYHTFSVPELFRTLFAPWKRDEVSTGNMSLGDKFHIWVGNMAGRFVALIIRSMTIIIGFMSVGVIFILGLFLISIVIIFPLLTLFAIIWGANGL